MFTKSCGVPKLETKQVPKKELQIFQKNQTDDGCYMESNVNVYSPLKPERQSLWQC